MRSEMHDTTRWLRALRTISTVIVLAAAALGCEPSRTRPPMRQVPGGDPDRGREALTVYGCGGCHSVPGVEGADSWVAPPLDRYGERAFVAGVISNNAENLTRWIMDPREVDPDTAMPDLGVPRDTARDMAAYLYTLREGS